MLPMRKANVTQQSLMIMMIKELFKKMTKSLMRLLQSSNKARFKKVSTKKILKDLNKIERELNRNVKHLCMIKTNKLTNGKTNMII
jgi:hypothetical protein